jgi:tetratricopeptide (TPR) repeat protein
MYNLAQETLFDAKKIIENSTVSQEYVFYEMLCYSDIGYLYRLQGKLQEALEMYEKVSTSFVNAHR